MATSPPQPKEKRTERIGVRCTKETKRRLKVLCYHELKSEGDLFEEWISAKHSQLDCSCAYCIVSSVTPLSQFIVSLVNMNE